MATKRRFTDEQKLDILQQAERKGITAVLHEYRLSYSVFSRWRQKSMKEDTGGREEMIQVNKTKSELKQFMEDNTRLKKIVADQALELERKDEALKKTNSSAKR